MKHLILLFSFAVACTPNNSGVDTSDTGDSVDDTDDTNDTEDTDTDDTDTETDTDTDDTAPPVIVLEEGTWSLATPKLVSDTCDVNKHQDVTEFVPLEIMIAKSSETSFNIDTGTVCTRNDLAYQCTEQNFVESALLGSAELEITSVMSGDIRDASNIDITFDVTIESCKGIGCLAIETVLKFPCPVTLTTTGNAR